MWKNITEPSEEPISLPEAKEHIRQSSSVSAEEDALLETMIVAAREAAEAYCNRPLVPHDIMIYASKFPTDSRTLNLGVGGVISVSAIRYRDGDGVMQDWPSTDWRLHKRTKNQSIILLDWDASWPSVRAEDDSVQIEALAGFESEESPEGNDGVPGAIKAAIKLMVADMYRNREGKITGTIVTENKMVESLLHFHRVEIMSE